MPSRTRLLLRCVVCCLSLLAWSRQAARAEGSAQVGTNQNLQSDTLVYVDIKTAGEVINWALSGGVEIYDPAGTLVQDQWIFSSGSYTTQTAGRFQVIPKSNGLGTWNISVGGTAAGRGRVHSPNWHFDTGTYASSGASNASFYAMVPGGAAGKTGVVELKLDGLSGRDFTIGANRTGVGGVNAGRSVPDTGNSFSPSFEMYLLPPELATYDPMTPTVTNYTFAAGAKSCNLIVPGSTTGTFRFDTNVDGTYHLVCDLNKDGTYDRVAATDVLIVGLTTPGQNSVTWNGKDNAGNNVPTGDYNCKVYVNVGELHFVGRDIETSYEGLRLFTVSGALAHSPLTMFWNDTLVQGNDVNMPAPTSAQGLATSGAGGIDSQSYATAAVPNVNAHSWGNFGSSSKGNNAFIDTFASIASVSSTVAALRATTSGADTDSDTLTDYLESCTLGTDRGSADSDGDGVGDGVEASGGNPIDTDGDGTIDALDADSDGDGVNDGTDTARTDENACRDQDADQCDDCVNTGSDGSGGAPGNDGADFDADGKCNTGDPDDDNDGVADGSDTSPLDNSSCADADGDGCNDCVNVHTGGGSTSDDGTDTDADGLCDLGDPDDDGDGVPDAGDGAPLNDSLCQDLDADTCDDCAVVHTGGGSTANDGADDDADGICNAGETTPPPPPPPPPPPIDTDGDGVNDDTDADIDDDGIANAREGDGDTDGDGLPDAYDLDSDADGITDLLEAGGAGRDQDGDGRIDETGDADGDGLDDSVAGGAALALPDLDGDGTRDFQDRDTDADGVPDAIEGHDFDADGDADKQPAGDGNRDGLDDAYAGQLTLPNRDKDAAADYRDPDDDNDGLSTETELADAETFVAFGADPDADGVPSYLDAESDGDGVTDAAESFGDGDLDGDAVPDYLQPHVYPKDTDGDGIPDYVERRGGVDVDSDGDGLFDHLDPDDDGDGLPTTAERPGAHDADSDGDGLFDHLDPDDDNDRVPTATELAAGGTEQDTDQDQKPDHRDTDDDDDGLLTTSELGPQGEFIDTDADGMPDHLDADDDGDGIPTRDELALDGSPLDDDGDGTPDHLDADDDDDGIPTKDEHPGPGDDFDADIDGDGIPNHLDKDSDGDGRSDAAEAGKDFDGDGIPDYQEPPVFGYAGGALCSTQGVRGGGAGAALGLWVLMGVLVVRRRRNRLGA